MANHHPELTELRRGVEAPKARGTTIFVVDDEPMVGEVVVAVLGLEGLKTRLFTSPADALDAFSSAVDKPDLMITDYRMEPFGGLDLIAQCRDILPGFRAILYTGSPEDIDFQEVQPDAFLLKPFLPRELLKTVAAVLAR